MNVLFFKEDFVQRGGLAGGTFAQQSASFMNVLFFKEDFVQRGTIFSFVPLAGLFCLLS
jgi:hypothetical protein